MKKRFCHGLILPLVFCAVNTSNAADFSVPADGTINFAVSNLVNGSSNTILVTANQTIASAIANITANLALSGTSQPITINFNGANKFAFSGTTGIFSIENITLTGATTSATTVVSGRTLGIDNVIFSNNSAATSGGAINNSSGILNIDGSSFVGNTAVGTGSANGGGAIYNAAGGQVVIANSAFTGNTATGRGGAIHNLGVGGGSVTVNPGTTFNNNSASYAGAIYNDRGILNIGPDVAFNSNTATLAFGGAIYNSAGTTTIGPRAVFNNNSAGVGGAVVNSAGTVTIGPNAAFNNNTAVNSGAGVGGGAIYNLTGTFNIGSGATFNNNSVANGDGGAIYNAATLNLDTASGNITFTNNTARGISNDIHNTSTINITGAGIVNLGGGVSGTAAGAINQNSSGGVILGQNSINNSYVGTYSQTAGTTTVLGNSFFGGINNILNSNLNLLTTSPIMSINSLNLTNAVVNSINNVVNTFNVTNFSANGVNNFSTDINGLLGISDRYILGNSTGAGIINVSNFNVLAAPTALTIDIPVFVGDTTGFTFTSSVPELVTPIYIYHTESLGNGVYRLGADGFNPQVFRGQVATLATYQNQLAVNNMLFEHVYIDSELYGAFDNNKFRNKYAAISPLFAPYQYHRDEGSVWYKMYGNFEKLFMTQNLDIDSNAYGAIIGTDFHAIQLKRGWKFLPTTYVAYNGGHQTFNGVSMYQNGGQGGFMGTFNKGNYIASILGYGGGYFNYMTLQGVNDKTGNWFAGTAIKNAYNYRVSKHFIIQPTALVSWNIFGNQHWDSDFGSVSMVSGFLNGINAGPGLNFIYGRETWNAYMLSQYIFNINDRIDGRIADVNLPTIRMRHGYAEIGWGVMKIFKERLMTYAQFVFREGGRRGVGFQAGLMWTY